MNRLDRAFADRKAPLLIAFTVAGDPDFNRSLRCVEMLDASGADVIELGMPYSDPTADGPVIQRADMRALEAGMTPEHLFDLIRRVRRVTETPLVLLCYYNVCYRYGVEKFCREAGAAGLDGLLCVDLPPEQSGELLPACREAGIDRILMAAPSTGDERLGAIGRGAEGFVYAVSTAGVTGVRDDVPPTIAPLVNRLRLQTDLPIAVGFGIATPEQAAAVAATGADGVIVGSAIVKRIEDHIDDEPAMLEALTSFVGGLRAALAEHAQRG
jgi:tryptophan synthase alpha chain